MFRAGILILLAAWFIALPIQRLQASPQSPRERTEHQKYSGNGTNAAEVPIDGPFLPELRKPIEQAPTYYLQWNAYPDKEPSGFLWIPWDGWVALFTLVLAAVSIWQGFQIRKGERLTIAALRSSQRQARAAIRAAHAAENTVTKMEETAERQLRAYIGISKGHVSLEVFEGKPHFRASLRIKNSGQTPAYKIRTSGGMEAGTQFNPKWQSDKDDFPQNTFLLPNGETNFRLFKTDFALPPKNSKKLFLTYVFGRVDYIDAFNKPRWTIFRFNASGDLLVEAAGLIPCEEGNDAN